jgi:hypothetical protein
MTLQPEELPIDLHPTVAQLARLARERRHLGAVIFGSVALQDSVDPFRGSLVVQ